MWFRDRQAIFWTFFLPLVLMVILGVLNFGDLGAVNLAVVDEANNEASHDLAANLEEVESFDLFNGGTKDQEIEALSDGDRDLVLVIPPNFAESGGPVTVLMFFNAGQTRETQVGAGRSYARFLDQMTFAVTDVPGRFTIDAQPVDSRNLRFIDFLLPGIVAMSIMQMGLFSVAFSFIQLKSRGILRRLLATPVHPASFLFAQVFTRLTVSILQTLVLIGVAVAFFNVDIAGNMASILLLALLGGGVFVSLGFAVSGWARSEEVAAPLANVIALPMMFLSGRIFPPEYYARCAGQSVTDFLPLSYLIDALRNVATDGEVLWTQGWNILGLVVWLAISFFRGRAPVQVGIGEIINQRSEHATEDQR